jgi:hypothetical protein
LGLFFIQLGFPQLGFLRLFPLELRLELRQALRLELLPLVGFF